MLVDGTAVGLGELLRPKVPPETPLRLRVLHPGTGEELAELSVMTRTTAAAVRSRAAAATGLREHSMVLARGKPGERIGDTAENQIRDGEEAWRVGWQDGDAIGFLYLGDAAADLAAASQ